MKIAIIGTAGRPPNGQLLTREMYGKIYRTVLELIEKEDLEKIPSNLDLVSGGAAWMDHIAISLWHVEKGSLIDHLHLHFPAEWTGSSFKEGKERSDPGRTANYYHGLFSEKMGADSLQGIKTAIKEGATYDVSNGFHARNYKVGKCDWVIAGTFSPHKDEPLITEVMGVGNSKYGLLADGGTQHTWNGSPAPHKTHINLWRLL